jgi:hypothetical protein
MPVRGHDGVQRPRADQVEQALRLGRGVDEHPVAGLPAGQEVGVVVHLTDTDLEDLDVGKHPQAGGATRLDVPGVWRGLGLGHPDTLGVSRGAVGPALQRTLMGPEP